MLEMLDYDKDEIIGLHWSKFISPGYHTIVENEDRNRARGIKSQYEVSILSKKGIEIPVFFSTSPIYDEENFKGILASITDISDIKNRDEEKLQKMLNYKIERGNVYLVGEKQLDKGREVFLELLQAGFKGLVITRTPPSNLSEIYGEETPVFWLSEKQLDEMTLPPNFMIIEKTVEKFLERDMVILFDRMDYLILKNGFKKTMEFIQLLSELLYIQKSVMLISLDPEILEPNDLRWLEKEAKEVKLKEAPDFPEDLYEILEFVNDQNKSSVKPAHKDIEKELNISRTTASKRIQKIVQLGLISNRKDGTSKVLIITEKGRQLASTISSYR